MRDYKHTLLINLADYTELLHLALEGKGISADDRQIYLGHLAMCARIFKVVYLSQQISELETIIKIEDGAYLFGTPNNERGELVKDGWNVFLPFLNAYISNAKKA